MLFIFAFSKVFYLVKIRVKTRRGAIVYTFAVSVIFYTKKDGCALFAFNVYLCQRNTPPPLLDFLALNNSH